MIRYLAGILSLTATLALVGCTETTVETRVDTLRVHDTLKIALARFISMMPDNSAINLKLVNSVDSPIYATTLQSTQAAYLPMLPDSAQNFYLYNGTTFLDSIFIAKDQLRKGSVNTFGLFWNVLNGIGHIRCIGGDNNDSTKLQPIPPGYARVRFLYGNEYLYSRPLDLMSDQNRIATANFAEISGYSLVPSGKRTLSLMDGGQPTNISTVGIFQSGMFYTVRYIGDSSASHPARLIVEAE